MSGGTYKTELGWRTSTFEGAAIATIALTQLVFETESLVMFAVRMLKWALPDEQTYHSELHHDFAIEKLVSFMQIAAAEDQDQVRCQYVSGF